jgi:MraZ protein
VLRGTYTARIDDKGRLKIPSVFRALIENQHGTSVYVTSVTGASVRVYPMPLWLALEERLARAPSFNPSVSRFRDRVNYFGQEGEVDAQGRLLISPRLRESAGMAGEVDVIGHPEYLELWNHARFVEKMAAEPFTDQDAKALSEFGI